MKKLTMWLGCALTAFAIGCGAEGSKTPAVGTTDPKTMDPAKMKEMMEKNMSKTPAAGNGATETPADADKKDGDTDKKEGDTEKNDSDTEKKEGETEKKEGDAGEK